MRCDAREVVRLAQLEENFRRLARREANDGECAGADQFLVDRNDHRLAWAVPSTAMSSRLFARTLYWTRVFARF